MAARDPQPPKRIVPRPSLVAFAETAPPLTPQQVITLRTVFHGAPDHEKPPAARRTARTQRTRTSAA